MRIGIGYDVHRLTEGRKLFLLGVEIPYEKGLLGHSDADVAAHALMDAMLGAAALGDIGKLYPDKDPVYEGISSMTLLQDVERRIREAGFEIGNLDVIIIAQAPKIAPYREEMREKLAGILKIPVDRISVKATTEEGLGFTGRGEGIAAKAAVLLKEQND
ncbi:MAG: 2-C-methyl-D-erythritol 2,4-cyclodiphosphate synthase [Lachnospiraceae bacterium]|nr:2-C-methyl-D-erythritol 2,4-cyclodiphosphate synthase [Lachnospiraceae bacterium]